MTQHLFTVYDSKAEAYLQPFAANTYGIAERMFSDMVNQQGHQFNRHPQDYSLYAIGTFETTSAQLSSKEHVHLANGLTVLIESEPTLLGVS